MARYKFYNINPLGAIEEDCVIRAISLALKEDYDLIYHKLELIGELYECEFLCKSCYGCLLDDVYELDRIESFNGLTINEFLNICDNSTYLVRVQGHLTCIIDKCIYDLWDCSNEIIDTIWKI